MISRRALFGTGAGVLVLAGAVGYAEHSGQLDELAGGIGLKPRPQPAQADRQLIARVRREQSELLLLAEATAASQAALANTLDPLIASLKSQLKQLGGMAPEARSQPLAADAAPTLQTLGQQLRSAEAARSREAMAAISGEFAQVLGAISAGLAQHHAALSRA